MNRPFRNPLNPTEFITAKEYFEILSSKLYDKKLDTLNKPLDK